LPFNFHGRGGKGNAQAASEGVGENTKDEGALKQAGKHCTIWGKEAKDSARLLNGTVLGNKVFPKKASSRVTRVRLYHLEKER